MSKAIIFGTGSIAQVVHFYLTHDSEYEIAAFTVHEDHMTEKEFCGLPVVPFETVHESHPPDLYRMYVAVGYRKVNRIRTDIYHDAKKKGYELLTYINSKCTHWRDTQIGDNCFIFEDNTIQPFVTVGNNVVIWSGNHIGHHVTIGDHCFISSHVVISGHCRVGAYSFLGVNATLRDNIRIGESCVIGAGAVITKPTRDKSLYVPDGTSPHKLKSDEINF